MRGGRKQLGGHCKNKFQGVAVEFKIWVEHPNYIAQRIEKNGVGGQSTLENKSFQFKHHLIYIWKFTKQCFEKHLKYSNTNLVKIINRRRNVRLTRQEKKCSIQIFKTGTSTR